MNWRIGSWVLLVFLVSSPCLIQGQIDIPWWNDPDVREVKYPSDKYYTGFAIISISENESIEQAVIRAKQVALGELSDRILVTIYSDKQSKIVSINDSNLDEQIRSAVTLAISTESQTDVTGSIVETYLNKQTNEIFAFAYASKAELVSYYRNQIELFLCKAENIFEIALERLKHKEKRKASCQCEETLMLLNKLTYLQQLLSAIIFDVDERFLQQNRSEELHRKVLQMLMDLENSTYIYINCKENIKNNETNIIGDMLPGLLTNAGCDCNFTSDAGEADYVIYVTASISRSNKVENNMMFCWAKAVVEIRNNYTNRTIKPQIEETKDGNISYETASQKAFEKLAKDIAKQVIQYIK